MIKMKLIISSTLLLLLFHSCKNEHHSDANIAQNLTVKIIASAGDDYDYIDGDNSIPYMNLPFNLGQHITANDEEIEFAVVGRKISNRKRVEVNVIGVLNFEENGQSKFVIVATPLNSSLISLNLNQFSDLVVKHTAVKDIIQSWYLNRCGLGCSRFISWENEKSALLKIEKLSK